MVQTNNMAADQVTGTEEGYRRVAASGRFCTGAEQYF